MPTSYTSLLGLALPTTGELSGTWGTTVNDAITSLLDSAVAGTTTLSTDADVTLTTTDGAANQARSAVLLCSGARTAIRTLTAPAKSKGYVIINATTGGYDVKIVGVGPTTGVLVPAGTRVFVVWNGSDFVKVASSAIAAATDITGILPTANGGTNLSSFTTNGAMYATSTSALTTGTLPTASGGTGLTTFSTNGAVYATSASALTTGTLPVEGGGTGAATLAANNVLLGNGTAAVQVVAPGTAGNVLTSTGSTWASQAISGFVTTGANNAFTGANTFYNNTGQTFGTATSTQDGILLTGRAGGTSSYRVTFVPGTLTASRTVTLPDATGVAVLDTATQTLTNKTLTDPAIIGTILEDVYTITDGVAFEVDPGNGSIQLITLGANRTPKATNFAAGEAVTMMIDDGAGYTITWTDATWGGSGVVWKTNGGIAPTLNTTGYTVIVLWKVSTQVYGARVGDA